jgi:hypothetical protein
MKTALSRRAGSTLLVTLIILATLSVIAAATLRRVTPKFGQAYQIAAWQEARLAAEAGVDAAMGDLVRNASGFSPGTWQGWKDGSGNRGSTLNSTLGLINSVLSLLLGPSATPQSMSPPIILDNLKVSTPGGFPTETDVRLWAIRPTNQPHTRWFRIRSMATCGLPPTAKQPPSIGDTALRRLSLREVRPQLRADDAGSPSTIPTPNVSRVVEVLVEPILPFELALWTANSTTLASTGTWCVDSYDSRDPAKSNPDGTYPGRTSSKVQEHGHVASNLGRPADSIYGPLISANGTRVRGFVATNGGDDPATAAHENVSGSLALDPARIRDDFCREMNPLTRPTTGLFLPPPLLGLLPYLPGTEAEPTQYLVPGNLGAFTVAAPATGRGAIVIVVNGDLNVSSGSIVIPPEVTALIFVRGNVDFHSSAINSGPGSSNRPAQLQIYAEGAPPAPRTVRADGDAAICAAFYGPRYDVRLVDAVEWYGSIAARSFEMFGGGTGGLHYDEALALVGPPISFRIARYVEDVRE